MIWLRNILKTPPPPTLTHNLEGTATENWSFQQSVQRLNINSKEFLMW